VVSVAKTFSKPVHWMCAGPLSYAETAGQKDQGIKKFAEAKSLFEERTVPILLCSILAR
jgi:hypothetical protein